MRLEKQRTERGRVGWRVWIECVDTDNLIVGARGQVPIVGGESYSMNRAGVGTH